MHILKFKILNVKKTLKDNQVFKNQTKEENFLEPLLDKNNFLFV
jgi:hypothetical protein